MSFAGDLLALKRKAQLRGRSVSKSETAGVVEGYARSASERTTAAKTVSLQEEGIASKERMHEESIASSEKLASEDAALQKELQGLDISSREDLQSQLLTAQKENLATQISSTADLQTESLEAQSLLAAQQMDFEYNLNEKDSLLQQRQIDLEYASAKKARRSCIIITACTSHVAYEVKIARLFRDECLDEQTLGGYYALCEIIIPFIDRSMFIRALTKKYLVDSFIDFAEHLYRIKNTPDRRYSKFITLCFLETCRWIGWFVDTKKWIKLHKD